MANAKREKDPLNRLYKDPRGRLTLHYIRFIGDLQPETFVMENVLGIIEGDLKEALRYEFGRVGYEVKFNVLEASRFGVPSIRTRVFISPIRIRPKTEKKVTVWEAIGDLPDPREPHSIPNHDYKALPRRVEKVIHKLGWGRAPVYFKGAKRVHQNYIRLHPNRVAPTVMGSSRFIHPFSDRLLTVRENARLMSFPDDHVFYGPIEQQYNQAGEAVPPKLAFKIAEVVREKVGNMIVVYHDVHSVAKLQEIEHVFIITRKAEKTLDPKEVGERDMIVVAGTEPDATKFDIDGLEARKIVPEGMGDVGYMATALCMLK